MSEDSMYTAMRGIALEGEDEISLSEGLFLIRPNKELLNGRWKYVMGEGEFEDEEKASRYLVCRYPSYIPNGEAFEEGTKKFYSGLMAIQVIKPVQTLGFIYSHQRIERRSPMDAGSWARMRKFDGELLAKIPSMIDRIQRVTNGDNAERKNALILLQLGLEHFHPYIAGLLWVMGLEAIFDSADRLEFKRKLCDCLGPDTLVFPDWNAPTAAPSYTVEDIAIHLYTLRSKLAHGADLRKAAIDKKYPVDLIAKVKLTEFSEQTAYATVLCEAACFLLCQVLQKLL